MAEYYGYAEKDASSQVNWAEIGKNLSDTIQEGYRIREEKKTLLDKAMQDNLQELAKSPEGQNTNINGAVLSHADNSKQYLLQINKMLKNGTLKPKDYTLMMQNLSDDTKMIFDNAKGWQDAYGKILESVKPGGDGSLAGLDLAADVAAFGQFKNLQFIINPATGQVNGSIMKKDANGGQVIEQTKTMQQLKVLMNQPIKKYKLTDVLVAQEKTIGEWVNSTEVRAQIQQNGSITKVTDKRISSHFNDAMDTYMKEVMANPYQVMSILRDSQGVNPKTGEAYKVSTIKNDKDPNNIYCGSPEGDGSYVPEFTAEQTAVAKKYVRDQFIGMIDHSKEINAVGAIAEKSAAGYGEQDKIDKSEEIGREMGLLVSGNDVDKRGAITFFEGIRDSENKPIFGRVSINEAGQINFKGAGGAKGRKDQVSIKGASKKNAAMQMYSQFENTYGPSGLNRKVFFNAMMKAGGKNVVLPRGEVYSQTEGWNAAPPEAAGGANSAADFN